MPFTSRGEAATLRRARHLVRDRGLCRHLRPVPAAQAREAVHPPLAPRSCPARAGAPARPAGRGHLRRVGDRLAPALRPERALGPAARRRAAHLDRGARPAPRGRPGAWACDSATRSPARRARRARRWSSTRPAPGRRARAQERAARAHAAGEGRAPHPRPALLELRHHLHRGRRPADVPHAARERLHHRHHRRRLLRRPGRPARRPTTRSSTCWRASPRSCPACARRA